MSTTSPARTTNRTAWVSVSRREFEVRALSKSFIVSTLITLLIVVALAFLPKLFDNPKTTTIAVTSPQGQAVVALANETQKQQNSKTTYAATTVADEAEGERLVKDDKAKALLVQTAQGWKLTFSRFGDDSTTIEPLLKQAVVGYATAQNAAARGIDLRTLANGSDVTSTALAGGNSSDASRTFLIGLVFSVLFFSSAMGYGMQIASSVLEEKQSRIVEILVSAIPVRQLLAGKVIGNTVIALGQLVLILAAGMVALSFTDMSAMLPMLSGGVGWFIVFFIAGFLALACIWAAAGSLATRNEDLGQSTMPLMMVLMVAYMAGFMAQGSWKVALSYVPVISSTLMPTRIMLGEAEWWEALIALALTVAFCAVAVVAGDKMYRAGLFQTGRTTSYRKALLAKEAIE